MDIFASTLGTASVSIPDMPCSAPTALLRLLLLVLVLGIMQGIRHGQGEQELEWVWVWVCIWGRRRVLHILEVHMHVDMAIASDEEPTYTRQTAPLVAFSSRGGAHVQPTNTPALQKTAPSTRVRCCISALVRRFSWAYGPVPVLEKEER